MPELSERVASIVTVVARSRTKQNSTLTNAVSRAGHQSMNDAGVRRSPRLGGSVATGVQRTPKAPWPLTRAGLARCGTKVAGRRPEGWVDVRALYRPMRKAPGRSTWHRSLRPIASAGRSGLSLRRRIRHSPVKAAQQPFFRLITQKSGGKCGGSPAGCAANVVAAGLRKGLVIL